MSFVSAGATIEDLRVAYLHCSRSTLLFSQPLAPTSLVCPTTHKLDACMTGNVNFAAWYLFTELCTLQGSFK
jgi:hypothetical protein